MTAPTTSQKDLVAFIDFLKDKGLMNTATAVGRKAAVNTLFSALDAAETADVTTLNLDEVAKRFMNKRNDVKPNSVKVYKSRVHSAIVDFKKYRADPLNFKVGVVSKPVTRSGKNSSNPTETAANGAYAPLSQQPHHLSTFVSPSEIEIVVPIPIRANTIVKIVGLPSDLTKQEATRIANVIQAFATVDDPKLDSLPWNQNKAAS
jgi:hypothetical protein